MRKNVGWWFMKDDYAKVAALYDFLQREFPVEQLIEFIFRYFEKHTFKPKSVLDIGCGTGTFVVELHKKGLKCFGLDASSEMVAVAKKKAKDINFSVGDMTNFSMDAKVDFITAVSSPLYMNNFGKNQRSSCFKSVIQNLKETGYFIFDVINFENFEKYLKKKNRKFPIKSRFEHEDVIYNTSIEYINPDKISVKIFKDSDNSLVLEQVYERGSIDRLKKELLDIGFSDVHVTINKMGIHRDYLFFAKKC